MNINRKQRCHRCDLFEMLVGTSWQGLGWCECLACGYQAVANPGSHWVVVA